MQGSTIMLVEDNPLTRKLVRTTLQREGCKLLEAADAASAMGLIEKRRFDLVLQDLVLPDASGFELVQKLRAHPHGGSVPILAFTGLLSQSDEARVSAAGFDGVLTKPIEPSRLLQIVRGHLPQLQLPAVPFGGGKKLLVVDDDPLQLKLARFRLGRLGFEIGTAENGEEALEAARGEKPDAIVTDALMPRLDGFGLCLALREDPKLADVPIVLMTSSYVEKGDRELARRAGANAFVLRTADLGDVITALHDIFGGHATVPPPQSEREPTQEVESARALRNLRQLERQVALNSGLMQRCSTLAAELSVLSTVADALVNTRDIEGALFEILVNCLDVAGASRGAIYLKNGEGKLKVRAHHGYSAVADELDDFFGHREVLDCMTARGPILEVASLVDIGELSPNLGEGALLVPLSARGELMGTLLLDAPQRRPITEDWRAFAQAIGNQVSLALSLARAFAQVESSELRTRTLMENAEDAIFVGTVDGVIVDVNHAGERLLGLSRDRILGRHFREFRAHADDEEYVAPQATRRAEGHIVRGDGSTVPVEYAGALVDAGPGERLFMAIVRDVSERNALAEQLRHAQKMEAVGRLAGGVAHDFNNILSVVIGYSELLLSELPEGDPLAQNILEIRRAGSRAAELTRQLLAFSRRQVLQPRILVLNEVLTGMERMVRRLIGEDVELAVNLAPDLGRCRADTGQIHQVVLNLVVNARDAMPHGGTLCIETKNLDVTEATARRHASLAPGAYVCLTVRDTGTGMDDETMAHIFEPFFTTKEAGKGTGLGLATVFGIVQQSGGAIWVESEEGKGTTFYVCLPRTGAVEEEDEERSTAPLSGGGETILLVEDSDQVRTLVRGILARAGYRVLECANAGEALLVCEQHEEDIDLLLADLVMPRMGGQQLAERLREPRPEMKVLFMSGYTDDTVLAHAGGDVPFLQKPITPDALTRKIREVLDSRK